MIIFILGISVTINITSFIAFFIIYKYSLKNIKNKIEDFALNNFMDDDEDFNLFDIKK